MSCYKNIKNDYIQLAHKLGCNLIQQTSDIHTLTAYNEDVKHKMDFTNVHYNTLAPFKIYSFVLSYHQVC